MNEKDTLIHENSRVPGLCYVYTDTGLELAVLDITHPMFVASIDEEVLSELCKKSSAAAESMKALPEAQKKIIAEKSYIFGTHFYEDSGTKYVSAMSTYMLKLGPTMIGGGEERNIDRMATMSISGIAARMRLREMCELQVGVLIEQLQKYPQKDICFINIGGGAASDSINPLILIQKDNLGLLCDRKIEIHLFDIDDIGAHFAEKSLAALKKEGSPLQNLKISFNFHKKDWSDIDPLIDLLSNKQDDILICTSEGGLFEYGGNNEIINSLNAIYELSSDETRIVGSLLLEKIDVDPTVLAMAETSGACMRFLGSKGLEDILAKTQWTFETTVENNPVYVVFALKKLHVGMSF